MEKTLQNRKNNFALYYSNIAIVAGAMYYIDIYHTVRLVRSRVVILGTVQLIHLAAASV